jgi:hypothetical protein
MDAAAGGDAHAADKLFATLYVELHRLGKKKLARLGKRPEFILTKRSNKIDSLREWPMLSMSRSQ